MNTLSRNDFQIFEQLCQLTQKQLSRTVANYLRKKYIDVTETDKYVYAIGEIPIVLIAHMDTVFKGTPQEVLYDREKNIIMSPQGLGADDRAGVFAILQILRTSTLRPHILFTTDEEIGAIGAYTLAAKPNPFPDLRYAIQLDRRGMNDCVFYDCDNPTFVQYVENFGFKENWGTFSDISVLCPAWKVAGVNLSIGYRDEHSVSEVLFVSQMLSTIEKVKTMLQETDIPTFEYIPFDWEKKYKLRYPNLYSYGYSETKCGGCGTYHLDDEMCPVYDETGTYDLFCPDCIVSKVNWCFNCGRAFVRKNKDECLCPVCSKGDNELGQD